MKIIGIAFAVISAVIWGIVYALNEKILTKFTPIQVMFVEAVIYISMILPLMFFTNQFPSFKTALFDPESRPHLLLLLLTILITGIANWLILLSITRVGSSIASVFEIAYPFFVIIFTFLFYGKQITLPAILGGICIFIGSFIIVKWS